jgi:ubiquinone/menaquinone biosynthesis C-methylase UbiE
MRNPAATRLRAEWIPRATGDVLEVGIGSGSNLPFYTDQVRRVYGLDPSLELQRIARRRAAGLSVRVEFILQPAEDPIPLPTRSIDTVVLTWTLCSVRDPQTVLREIRRILKSEGQLIFIEHGRAPDAGVRLWQRRFAPLWCRVSGGCALCRDIPELFAKNGFLPSTLATGYLPGPRPITYTYRGIAGRTTTRPQF